MNKLLKRDVVEWNHKTIERRSDLFLENLCLITPIRGKRPKLLTSEKDNKITNMMCIFCPENINKYVDLNINGKKYYYEGTWIFKNKYPFEQNHFVETISKKHFTKIEEIEEKMFNSSFVNLQSLIDDLNFYNKNIIINMNFGFLAGASQPHPHMQILFLDRKTSFQQRLENKIKYYNKWIEEHDEKGLVIKENESLFLIPFSPLGNMNIWWIKDKEITEVIKSPEEICRAIYTIIKYYKTKEVDSFNFSIFEVNNKTFLVFICRSFVGNKVNDFGFMETIHKEKVIEKLPEKISEEFKEMLKYKPQ